MYYALGLSVVAGRRAVWTLLSLAVLGLAAMGTWGGGRLAAQELSTDQKSALALDGARRAYNERQYDFAAQRFREFLQQFGGHRDAVHARYGLALTLLESPARDIKGASEALQSVVGVGDFPDRPWALYHFGACYRHQGHAALAQAEAKPQEAQQHRNTARQQFEQAEKQFAAALAAFEARVPAEPADDAAAADADAPLSELREWAARTRCDQAEMLAHLGKPAEAGKLVERFVDDPLWARSRYAELGRYYYGHAAYVQGDYLTAGRTLSELAPFRSPIFGVHARYLLARVHHLAGERTEAAGHYAELLADFAAQVQAAQQALQNAAVNQHPAEKERLEALARRAAPDYIARADFYLGVLLFEQEQAGAALERFGGFAQLYPTSLLRSEAQLRAGLCQVELRQFPAAIATLTPLQDDAALGDRARWWLGRAHFGGADSANPQAYAQSLNAAIDQLRRAAERAGQLAGADPDARLRRADMLLELADAQQAARQYKEAVATYQTVLNEKVDPDRVELAWQRQATAHHLAGSYPEADNVCRAFVQAYPTSPLLAPVLFRYAENAYAVAQGAAQNPNLANRQQELEKLFGEAIQRYGDLLERFPEFEATSVARHGLAMSHYHVGRHAEAAEILAEIPAADRNGNLAGVPYVLADCLIRTTPAAASDALSAGRVLRQMEEAQKQLETFVASSPQDPRTPDAMLKIGHCRQRVAEALADPAERAKAWAAARETYDRLRQQHANHPAAQVAVFERANCLAAAGDVGGAINELNRFQGDPLAQAPIAPLAMVRLATLLRSQGKPAEAAQALQAARQRHEGALRSDPVRGEWLPLLLYHHGLALEHWSRQPDALPRLAEAQTLFETIHQQFPHRSEGWEAAWRAGQCRRRQAQLKIDAAVAARDKPDAKPEERTAAAQQLAEALKGLRDVAAYFETQWTAVGQRAAGSEPHLRMHYEAAWCYRQLAEHEIAAARAELREQARAKLQQAAVEATPAGEPVPPVNAPEISLPQIPVQPSEQLARQRYQSVIDAADEAPLSQVVRLELAELHSERHEHDEAINLLFAALDLDPPAELEHPLRLRLGMCLLAKNDPESAALEFEEVAAEATGVVQAEARYRTAEALALAENWDGAIEQLAPFHDQQALQNLPGLSDRALLRLGHAYGRKGQWDASRQAVETLLGRFNNSPWRDEARYAQAWAWQNQGQLDAAINTYGQITRSSEAEVAARAQLQIGLCLLEKKQFAAAANALLVVPFTYDYPELSALALCEASRALAELKQPVEAARLLRRVAKNHPTSPWAEVAQQRLAELEAAGQ